MISIITMKSRIQLSLFEMLIPDICKFISTC